MGGTVTGVIPPSACLGRQTGEPTAHRPENRAPAAPERPETDRCAAESSWSARQGFLQPEARHSPHHDRHRCHGDASRHLDDRQQGVQSAKVFGGNGNADDGKRGLSRQHARQVRRPSGPGDDHLQTARPCLFGIGKEAIRRTMRRDHQQFVGDAELVQERNSFFQDRKIGRTSADYSHGHSPDRSLSRHISHHPYSHPRGGANLIRSRGAGSSRAATKPAIELTKLSTILYDGQWHHRS